MKKIKAFIEVIDELDIINGIIKIISFNDSLTKKIPIVRFPINRIEYEDEEHRFIYVEDVIRRVLNSLEFKYYTNENNDLNVYKLGNIYIRYYEEKFEDNIDYLVIEKYYPQEPFMQIEEER